MKAIAFKFIQQFLSQFSTILLLLGFSFTHALILFVLPNDFNILEGRFADLELYFASIPYILMVLVPAIGMGSFAQEVQSGTLEILLTKPLDRSHLIWGKFFGVFGVTVLWLLPLGVYAISIAKLSNQQFGFDWGIIFSASLGLILLSSFFAALSVWASLKSNRQVLALLLSWGINGVFWWGWEYFSRLITHNSWSDWMLRLSVQEQFKVLSKGLINPSAVLYLVLLSLLFLFFTRRELEQNKRI